MKNLRAPQTCLFVLLVGVLAPDVIAQVPAVNPKRVEQIASWLRENPSAPGKTIGDRQYWAAIAKAPGFEGIIPEAERMAASEAPALTEDLFLDFSRTGNRTRAQYVMHERSRRVQILALAECFENRGRFLKALTNTLDTLCAERTWVYPAHDRKLDNFYGRSIDPDLHATAVAWDLATVNAVLGEKLSMATRAMIADNVQRRVLKPVSEMALGRQKEIHWLTDRHNWNAVCLANTVGAALATLESRNERALFVAAAEHYIRNFLSGFTPDGYCSEGISYWNYGFGHFIMLTELLREATGGKIDLFTDPTAIAPALYSTRTEILNGVYPSIADSAPGSRPDARLLQYVRERLEVAPSEQKTSPLRGLGRYLGETVLFNSIETPLPKVARAKTTKDSPLRTWFDSGGLLICRTAPGAPQPFAAAIKGGHNAEFHNHNDLGSFSVVSGSTMVLCDPGSEVYTARTFGPRRYDSQVLNSFGHSVPVVAGKLQSTGRDAKAILRKTDFTDDADSITFDLKSAYPVKELKKLERTFTFRRGLEPALTVRDEISFSDAKTFESALITWGEWKQISGSELHVVDGKEKISVKVETGGQPFQVSSRTLEEDVQTSRKPVRIAILLATQVTNATVTLVISPVVKR